MLDDTIGVDASSIIILMGETARIMCTFNVCPIHFLILKGRFYDMPSSVCCFNGGSALNEWIDDMLSLQLRKEPT